MRDCCVARAGCILLLVCAGCGGRAVVGERGRGKPDERAGAARLPKQLTLDMGDGVNMEFVLIQPGSFMMGDQDFGPVHKVTITKPFYLGKYEVTQAQWEKVMGNNPSRFKGAKNPVEQVSWEDCQEFVKKLGELNKAARTFRLPTEAEWEYACRAGSNTRYCFGDSDSSLGDYGWYSHNSANTTHPVGQKKPNVWGLHDMHGNVWEWCQDWDDTYKTNDQKDPVGRATGSAHVMRGGSWYFYSNTPRSAFRNQLMPGKRDSELGLRVVMSCAGS